MEEMFELIMADYCCHRNKRGFCSIFINIYHSKKIFFLFMWRDLSDIIIKLWYVEQIDKIFFSDFKSSLATFLHAFQKSFCVYHDKIWFDFGLTSTWLLETFNQDCYGFCIKYKLLSKICRVPNSVNWINNLLNSARRKPFNLAWCN